jgi:hypothetical protein
VKSFTPDFLVAKPYSKGNRYGDRRAVPALLLSAQERYLLDTDDSSVQARLSAPGGEWQPPIVSAAAGPVLTACSLTGAGLGCTV